LTPQQIDAYLANGGKVLAAVGAALRADAELLILIDTPLMLNIVALAYSGMPDATLQQTGIPTNRQQIYAVYIQRMLARRPTARYPWRQTQHWLAWLARQLIAHNQPIFYIERLQPELLPSQLQRWYRVLTALAFVLVGALSGWLVGMVVDELFYGLADGFYWARVSSIVGGCIGVLVSGIGWSTRIKPREAIVWSWRGIWHGISKRFLPYMIGGLIIVLILELARVTANGLIGGIVVGLGFGLIGGFVSGLVDGLSMELPDDHKRIRPNQGIWQSARNGLLFALSFGLGGGVVCGLVGVVAYRMVYGVSLEQVFDPFSGIIFGLVGGLIAGFAGGGDAWIQHGLMRLLLWRANVIPWDYVRFLDYATECILLRKVGGGYIFIHGLLLEHFAGLEAPGGEPEPT
jgi:hypothetical protein